MPISTTRRSANLPNPTQEKAPWNPRQLEILSGFRRASDIEAKTVPWVWEPYIPAGFITLLEGDPGLGKSMITCALAADLSQGRPLPGTTGRREPVKVLMLSQEDSAEHIIKQRLMDHDANLDNIVIHDRPFIFDTDSLKVLEWEMRKVAATIVFLDPLVGYMGAKVDMHKANETRAMLTPLAEIAKGTGSAIVLVRHLRKSGGEGNAKYAGLGSIDIIGAARSSLQVSMLPDKCTVMQHVKSNFAVLGPPLEYQIVKDRVVWAKAPDMDRPSPAIEAAQIFLHELLRNGPVTSKEVFDRAKDAGVSSKSLHRAKEGLATTRKTSEGHWEWALRSSVLAEIQEEEPGPRPDISDIVAQVMERAGRTPTYSQ